MIYDVISLCVTHIIAVKSNNQNKSFKLTCKLHEAMLKFYFSSKV